MTITKKQTKINKLFRKIATVGKEPEDCEDLLEEIQQLKQKLQEKDNELFQIQRNQLRIKATLPKKKEDNFVRPDVIVLKNSVNTHQAKLDLMCMLTSVEVQSYVAGDHCCVVFHMQHDSPNEVKHGLRMNIDMRNGANEISSSSLPLGFNLAGVMEYFDNMMKPDCLSAVRKALFAYYDRLEQYKALKKLVKIDATLFKIIDGSHIEIKLCVQSETSETSEDEEQFDVVLLLDYRVYDIRPKTYAIKESDDLAEGAAVALREQCAVFKKKPLDKAFKQAFVSGIGQYKLVKQMSAAPAPAAPRPRPRPRPRKRPAPRHYNNDDTFQPEDCSEHSDDDEVIEE